MFSLEADRTELYRIARVNQQNWQINGDCLKIVPSVLFAEKVEIDFSQEKLPELKELWEKMPNKPGF